MLRNSMRPAAILTLIAVIASPAPCVADPGELSTFIALARPAPTAVLQHGPSDSQAADLFLPSGDGPHPLAILIHGGCWSVTTVGREQLRPIGAELASRGIAVWSIGYRRANESGGSPQS
jgi:acetyl esterase/lipase